MAWEIQSEGPEKKLCAMYKRWGAKSFMSNFFGSGAAGALPLSSTAGLLRGRWASARAQTSVRCRITAQAIVRCRGNLCVCPVRVCMEPMRGIVSINYKHVPFALKYRLPRLLRVAILWVANPKLGNYNVQVRALIVFRPSGLKRGCGGTSHPA